MTYEDVIHRSLKEHGERSLFWLSWDIGDETGRGIISNEVKGVLNMLIHLKKTVEVADPVDTYENRYGTWTTYRLKEESDANPTVHTTE